MSYLYLVPKNVKTRFEFFTGFGWKELFITLIGFVIGVALFFIIGLITKSMLRILILIIPTIAAFMICRADPRTGLNLLQLINNFKNFKTKTQTYFYIFGEGRNK